MLKAVGKWIDTLPLKNLFSQEEHQIDKVIIETDRYYHTQDLAGFTFIMRGVTPSGGETETQLEKEILENTIRLTWTVSSEFTAEAGTLQLDLFAYVYQNPDTDRTQNPPDILLRYQLPAVEVRGLPDDTHTLDTQSWSEMLAQIREALASTSAMQTTVNTLNTMIQVLSATVTQDHERLQAIPDILVMTQEAYDELENPDENTLYVLT